MASAPGSPIAVAGSPGNIALGELDQDGKLDLVVASGRGITVLLGGGDGRFRVTPGSPVQGTDPFYRNGPARLKRRPRLDLALADHNSYGVALLFGDGQGGFALAPHSPVIMKDGRHPHTHGLNAGDLNGDGNVDLLTVNSDDNDLSIAFGDAQGRFARAPSLLPVGPSPYPARSATSTATATSTSLPPAPAAAHPSRRPLRAP